MSTPTNVSLAKELFSDCALIEIIHLHDCIRVSLQQIKRDVAALVDLSSRLEQSLPMEASNASLPAADHCGNDTHQQSQSHKSSLATEIHAASRLSGAVSSRFHLIWSVFQAHSHAEDEFIWPALKQKVREAWPDSNNGSTVAAASAAPAVKCSCDTLLDHQAYADDHAAEETMFQQIHDTIRRLHGAFRYYYESIKQNKASEQDNALHVMRRIIDRLREQTDVLTEHVSTHLKKEETQCLPMVQTHLSKAEISTLVGNIMGKRSAEVMTKILKLSMLSLPPLERMDMMLHMKEAMAGTFFEQWLTLGGWTESSLLDNTVSEIQGKLPTTIMVPSDSPTLSSARANIELGKLPFFDGPDYQRNKKRKLSDSLSVGDHGHEGKMATYSTTYSNLLGKTSRMIRPSRYYKIDPQDSNIQLVWQSSDASQNGQNEPPSFVPLFTETELTPTFRYSEEKATMVLGCTHYARACKLRHPETGNLFTCRLCCQELRESSSKTSSLDLPALDRYSVTEILCMKCGSLQPTGPRCINPQCSAEPSLTNVKESIIGSGHLFAKYYCSICNLFDDETKTIYHCPFCNVCRVGKGLGIDFRHCMQCNACVALNEYDNHVCIVQRLQGNCPICHEALFESTSPLRGMACGHVMHLSCFRLYAAKCSYGVIECPFCKRVEKTG